MSIAEIIQLMWIDESRRLLEGAFAAERIALALPIALERQRDHDAGDNPPVADKGC
jgi:hypothetical protein